jgi:hypothetical protein
VDTARGSSFAADQDEGPSTRIWTTYSAVGIQNSGRNHKRRSQSARRLDLASRVDGQNAFFGQPGKQHPDGGYVLFDRGRRGLALQDFDIRCDRDRFNVFEVLIPGALSPGQELLDCSVVGRSCVGVADRGAGARNDGWSCERIY